MAILTILRQELLELTRNRCAAEVLEFFKNQRFGWFKAPINMKRYRQRLRCCAARLLQMFKWLSANGKDAFAAHAGLGGSSDA